MSTVEASRSCSASLALHLFGAFDARLCDAPLPRLRTRKARWLLALLAHRPGAELARDWLTGTLWPDSPDDNARANLRSVLHDLRRALGPEAGRLRASLPRAARRQSAACPDSPVGVE